jgi:hypothetical protein
MHPMDNAGKASPDPGHLAFIETDLTGQLDLSAEALPPGRGELDQSLRDEIRGDTGDANLVAAFVAAVGTDLVFTLSREELSYRAIEVPASMVVSGMRVFVGGMVMTRLRVLVEILLMPDM